MRCTTVALLLLSLSAGLLPAKGSDGQDLTKTHITLDVRSKSLEYVFKEIEKTTGFRFAYKPEELSAFTDVSLHVSNRSLTEVLRLLLSPRGLTFLQKNNYIVVGLASGQDPASEGLQGIKIIGTVHDQLNTPLAGITVRNQKTGKTTATTGPTGRISGYAVCRRFRVTARRPWSWWTGCKGPWTMWTLRTSPALACSRTRSLLQSTVSLGPMGSS